jgi:quercetin dioxygenase-like cupin family protein
MNAMRSWLHVTCILGFFVGLAAPVGAAEDRVAQAVTPPSPLAVEKHSNIRMVLSTGTTVTGQRIRYPAGRAHVTAQEITLEPGQETGWHTHPVPVIGYILDGELTVDYGAKGQKVYHKGDGFVEALNQPHNGRNTGQEPVKILAIVDGVEGVKGAVMVPPPAQ